MVYLTAYPHQPSTLIHGRAITTVRSRRGYFVEDHSNRSHIIGILLPLRLAHIAKRCPPLERQSLTLAIAAAKKGKDVQLYERLCELARSLSSQDLGAPDSAWTSRTEEANRRELSRLEGELRGYKNNLIRESIRMGQEDLASHLLATGGPRQDPNNHTSNPVGYAAAFQAYGKMRDYCHTPSQVNAMTLRMVYTAFVQAATAQQLGSHAAGHYGAVHTHAARLRASGCKEEEQTQLTPLSYTTVGLAYLGAGNYPEAASAFLKTPFAYHRLGTVHGLDFERLVASANDVAIYGGLCALATMSREDLQEKVLDSPFRQFLEQEPHMRKAISLYVTAKYEASIALLQRYRADWVLDIFLAPHVDKLFSRIRQRSITAYFSSFSQVRISALATTFPPLNPADSSAAGSAEAAMENELLAMIQNGKLDARLDVVDGMLLAPKRALRRETHEKANQAASEIERTLLLRLHRVNIALAGLEIKREPKGRDAMSMEGFRPGGVY